MMVLSSIIKVLDPAAAWTPKMPPFWPSAVDAATMANPERMTSWSTRSKRMAWDAPLTRVLRLVTSRCQLPL
jgi:hypothetical protein